MSTVKLAITIQAAITIRIACTTARSRLATAETSSRPTPAQANTLSTTTAPATRLPIMKPMMVTVGMAGLGQHFQHGRAGEARHDGRARGTQGDDGQDRMAR